MNKEKTGQVNFSLNPNEKSPTSNSMFNQIFILCQKVQQIK